MSMTILDEVGLCKKVNEYEMGPYFDLLNKELSKKQTRIFELKIYIELFFFFKLVFDSSLTFLRSFFFFFGIKYIRHL